LREQLDRRTRELNEAREQQAATADVLKVISRSTFDLRMVLNTLVNSAARLCRAEKANIALLRGDIVDYVAQVGFPPGFLKYMQSLRLKVQRGSISGRAALEGRLSISLMYSPTLNISCSMRRRSAGFVLRWACR
jgi:hypothetical protein